MTHTAHPTPMAGARTSALPATAAFVDLDKPLPEIDARGAPTVVVALRFRGDTIGSVRVPAPFGIVPPLHLADAIVCEHGFELFLRSRLRRPEIPLERVPSSASIVVCSADRPDQLERALASIAQLRGPIFEVIVVDNGRVHTAATEAVAAAAGVRCVREPVAGLDRARNRGIAVARGSVILFTDDDVEVDPEWAARLLDCFVDPAVMAATGLVLPARLDTSARALSESMASHGRGYQRRILDGTIVSPTRAGGAGAGASMAFRAGFLRAIGGFPPELDAGTPTQSGGDTFALFQVLQAGYRIVYEPAAVAFHWHRDDDAALRRMLVGYGIGSASYLSRVVLDPERPAPVPIAVRALGSYVRFLAKRAVQAAVRRPGAPPLPHALDEFRGIVQAAREFPRARSQLDERGRGEDVARSPVPVPLLDELRLRANEPPGRAGTPPSLSIVIPTRARREHVCGLLAALDVQQFAYDAVEVIVVVDGDVDGTADAITKAAFRRLPRVLVLDATRDRRADGNGAAHARNCGAALAHNDVLVFLDDDLKPLGSHLLSAHALAQAGAGVLGVGPCPVDLRDSRALHAQMLRSWWTDQTVRLLDGEQLHFADVLSGNMSIRRSAFERLGGFAVMPRREDWDLACAAEAAGMRVEAVPAAGAVQEIVDPSVTLALADRRREGAGDVLLAHRHPQAAGALPLSGWRAATGANDVLIRFALRNPDRVGGVIAAGVQALRGYETIGARGRFQRLLWRLARMAYWAGVADAVGGEDGWHRFVDVVENLRPRVSRDVLHCEGDMVHGADVDVVLRDVYIGSVPAEFAGGLANRAAFDRWTTVRFLPELDAIGRGADEA